MMHLVQEESFFKIKVNFHGTMSLLNLCEIVYNHVFHIFANKLNFHIFLIIFKCSE